MRIAIGPMIPLRGHLRPSDSRRELRNARAEGRDANSRAPRYRGWERLLSTVIRVFAPFLAIKRAAFASIGASRGPTQATSRWRLVFVASAARFRMREIPFRRHAAAEMPCALFHYTRIAIRSAIPMWNYPNLISGCSGTPRCADRGPGCLA